MMAAGGSTSLGSELSIMELVLLIAEMVCVLKDFARKGRHLLSSIMTVSITGVDPQDLECVLELQTRCTSFSHRLGSDLKELIVFKMTGLGRKTTSSLYKSVAGLLIMMQQWHDLMYKILTGPEIKSIPGLENVGEDYEALETEAIQRFVNLMPPGNQWEHIAEFKTDLQDDETYIKINSVINGFM